MTLQLIARCGHDQRATAARVVATATTNNMISWRDTARRRFELSCRRLSLQSQAGAATSTLGRGVGASLAALPLG
jgi:hypothetical protein